MVVFHRDVTGMATLPNSIGGAQCLPPSMPPGRNPPPSGSRSDCTSNGSAPQSSLTRVEYASRSAQESAEALKGQVLCDSLLPLTVIVLSVLVAAFARWLWYVYPRDRSKGSSSGETSTSDDWESPTPHEDDECLKRKEDFLSRHRDDYGYAGAPCGHIDTWRAEELPGLILPMGARRTEHVPRETEVYVDYAGSALPTRSQLEQIQRLLSAGTVLANPHSTGPAASRTRRLTEEAKTRVLDLLHAHPGRYAAFASAQPNNSPPVDGDGVDHHPGYEVVFTSGTTEALRLLSERFPFQHRSLFVYAQNSHTSVIGMRGPVRSRGGRFVCRTMDELETDVDMLDPAKVWSNHETWLPSDGSPRNHLVAMPLECNFSGNRIKNARGLLSKLRHKSNGCDRYFSLLDIAKAASSSEVNLNTLNPDFAVLSFYKLFGEPTGLGCLLVKRTSISLLCPDGVGDDSLHYFGGGAVDAVLAATEFVAPRTAPTPLARLVNGTSHFRGIVALNAGIDELARVGGMRFIQRHSECLAMELVRRLRTLVHEANGRPVVQLYGEWKRWSIETSRGRPCPGPTVAFNIMRGDGSYVGYSEVSKLAALHRPPIQFRTGCFCNPGACQLELGFLDEELMYNFQQAGHVCGDDVSIVNGRPTGAIRVSFGKDSLWEDLDAVVCFVQQVFVSPHADLVGDPIRWDAKPRNAILTELYLFPIKSCAAQRVHRWTMSPGGKLSYDREFALVDSTGSAMRLQMYPKMAFIQPSIDDNGETMRVSVPGQVDLVIRLRGTKTESNYLTEGTVRVCGNAQCQGSLWGDHEVSEWFSNFLGVKCFLARFVLERYELPHDVSLPVAPQRSPAVAFANEQPLLLLSEKAVDTLNKILKSRNQRLVTPRHFRPNMVVAVEGDNVPTFANLEDGWSHLEFEEKNVKLEVVGPCPRCSMVDVDPTSGMKGKTLRALAEYRRRNGQINFGIFLRASHQVPNSLSVGLKWVEEGDVMCCA